MLILLKDYIKIIINIVLKTILNIQTWKKNKHYPKAPNLQLTNKIF